MSHILLRLVVLLVAAFIVLAPTSPASADEQQLQFDEDRLLITAIATMGAPDHGADVSVGQPIEFYAGTATAKFKNQDTAGHAWQLGYEMAIARQSMGADDWYVPPVNPFMLSLNPGQQVEYARGSELSTIVDVILLIRA